MRLFFLLLVFLVSVPTLFAQEPKTPLSVDFFWNAPEDQVLSRISRLTKEESQEWITQLRHDLRKDNPKVDRFYLVLSHLEEIQAIQKEQARLESVFWVFGLGFALFSGFVLYLILRLRKVSLEIQNLQEN